MSTSPALDVLLPTSHAVRRLEPREDEAELLALFGDPAGGYVRANMVASLDGGATGADHVSGSINGDADYRVFRALRALADVVVVGAGTARQESYTALDVPAGLGPARSALGLAPRLELAVVTATGVLPPGLRHAEHPPLVVTTAGCERLDRLADEVGADRVVLTGEPGAGVDLPAALAALRERGLTRVLTEGGPTLLGQLVAADLVDELCLTWTPALVGGPVFRILRDAPWLEPQRAAEPLHLLHAGGTLLGRWRIARLGA